jgi:hypothetical protein
MITLLLHIFRLLPVLCGSYRHLAHENLALRHQLSVYKRTMMRSKLRTTDRLFWIGLARVWAGWKRSLVISRPRVSLDTSLGSMMLLQGGGHGQTQERGKVTRARGRGWH